MYIKFIEAFIFYVLYVIGFTLSSLKIDTQDFFFKVVVCTSYSFDSNFGINNDFTEYLKGSC